jgi:hypothetical protein
MDKFGPRFHPLSFLGEAQLLPQKKVVAIFQLSHPRKKDSEEEILLSPKKSKWRTTSTSYESPKKALLKPLLSTKPSIVSGIPAHCGEAARIDSACGNHSSIFYGWSSISSIRIKTNSRVGDPPLSV